MSEILVNIKKESVEQIMLLAKRYEIFSSMPNQPLPFTCFLYSEEHGGVIAQFVCDDIDYEFTSAVTKEWLKDAMVSREEALKIADGGNLLYKWRIRSLIEYKEPRPFSSFGMEELKEPPKEWCVVNSLWKWL